MKPAGASTAGMTMIDKILARHAGVDRVSPAKQVFASYRPGWAREVREGDVLVGGPNFGTGSSRPAAELLRRSDLFRNRPTST